MTNRLRTEGTDHLLAAGRAVGARRFVAQSFGAFRPRAARRIPRSRPAGAAATALAAIRHLERAVTGIDWGEGLALRYGGFYGPGTGISLAPDAVMSAPIRKRRFPIVGDGGGVWSLIHIDDAAAATAIAVERGGPGVYDVVDDEPAPVREWLPALASALDAKPPRRVPRWLGRLAAGETATAMMTEVRGASNEKAKRELGWKPRYRELAAGLRARAGLSDDRGQFDELRPSAFAIAYRMLGSVSEAEDVVQEGFLRLHRARAGGEQIESPRAYLSTVVSRLSLDHLRSARVQREIYVGEWLPEPLVASADDDPARKAEMADSLSLAFLVMLESLSPEQRAAFLLREVFDEPYDRIAEIIGTSEQNARQLATRARRHVEERRPRFEASREQREELANRFFAAAEEGDLEGLEQLLAHDVVLHGDGGGKAPAARARDPRPRQGGARADRGAARRRHPHRRLHRAPRGGQRATGRAVLRPRGQADRRDDPRRRRGPDPGRELDRQPGQAAAPGAGGRPARAAAAAGCLMGRIGAETSAARESSVSVATAHRWWHRYRCAAASATGYAISRVHNVLGQDI